LPEADRIRENTRAVHMHHDPIRMLDIYYWLLATLRIKTIFLELVESYGIQLVKDSHGDTIKPQDYSQNGNYIAQYLSRLRESYNIIVDKQKDIRKCDGLLTKIYEQFISDTSPYASKKNMDHCYSIGKPTKLEA
jgi:hypothetical protein